MPDCAPPREPHFDTDVYCCPCGHSYGAHEYEYLGVSNTMVIYRCLDCDAGKPPVDDEWRVPG